MMKIIKERNSEEPIYIVGAYLIRDDLLRVVLITDCRTNSKFYASFFDNQSMIVAAAKNLSAMLDGCLTNACKYDGMYAEFEFPTKFVGDEVRLDIIDANNQSSLAMITVRRSVPPQQRKHRLAVCLPALFYYSDTVQLIEFIENWLLAGATKFYVYWQAITPAIKKVLLFYQASINYTRCGKIY
uniref:Glycosyltransferase family 92 protein n=1 Tax=Plectus sambesii TaxID=2011161 RepID=A0A914VXP0_9BILA